MALAFALIKQMLKLENRSKEACDFGRTCGLQAEQQLVQKKMKPLYLKPLGINNFNSFSHARKSHPLFASSNENVCIGDFVHSSRFIVEKCAMSKILFKALKDISAVDLHVAFSLLRMCGSLCDLIHLARVTLQAFVLNI